MDDETLMEDFISTILDQDTDVNVKLKEVNEIKKCSRLFRVASNVDKAVSALSTLLVETEPCFILEDSTQQLRKASLELIYYVGRKEFIFRTVEQKKQASTPNRTQTIASKLLSILVKLFEKDNEENCLVGFKIIAQVFIREKVALPSQLQTLIMKTLMKSYKQLDRDKMCQKPDSISVGEMGETSYCIQCQRPQTNLESSTICGDQCLQKFHQEMHLSVKISKRGKYETLLPLASKSLRVLTDAPKLINLSVQSCKMTSQDSDKMVPTFLDILNQHPKQGDKPRISGSLDAHFMKLQIKILKLLVNLHSVHRSLKDESELVSAFFSIWKNCPSSTVSLRRELLNSLYMIMETDLKHVFLKDVKIFLLDPFLTNRELISFDGVRPLYFHILLNVIEEIFQPSATPVVCKLSDEEINITIKNFLPALYDSALPIQMHDSVCVMLLNLLNYRKDETILLEMLKAFVLRVVLFKKRELPFVQERLRRCEKSFDSEFCCAVEFAYKSSPTGHSFISLLKNSSDEKMTNESKNFFTINDCKRFIINIIKGAISIAYIFKEEGETQGYQETQEYIKTFSELLKYLVRAMRIFNIPNKSYSPKDETQKEEHDALSYLAMLFSFFSSSQLYKIFAPNIDMIIIERCQNSSIQIFLQGLLFQDATSRELTSFILNHILNHVQDIDDVEKHPILVSLLNDVFQSLLKFSENDEVLEIFLLPMVTKCMESVLKAKRPCNFLKLMDSLFTIIHVGNFQSDVSQSLLPLLPSMLKTLEIWHRTAPNQLIKDQVLNLCLTISRTCTLSMQMHILPLILIFVVEAVNRSSLNLIQKGLKVLQTLDFLEKDFLDGKILPLKSELIQGLQHASKISKNGIDETAIQLLWRFYDPQHKCQNQGMYCKSEWVVNYSKLLNMYSIVEFVFVVNCTDKSVVVFLDYLSSSQQNHIPKLLEFVCFVREYSVKELKLKCETSSTQGMSVSFNVFKNKTHQVVVHPMEKAMESIFQLLQSNCNCETSTTSSDSLFKACFQIIKGYLAISTDQDYTCLKSQLLSLDFNYSNSLDLNNKSLEYFSFGCAPLKSWDTKRVALTNLFALVSCTEMDEVHTFFEKCVFYYTVLALLEGVSDKHHLGVKGDGVGIFVIINAVVEFLSSFSNTDVESRKFVATAVQALQIIFETCEIIFGYEKLWNLSFMEYMSRSVCSLCCKNPWHIKLFEDILATKLFTVGRNHKEDLHVSLILETLLPHITSPYEDIRLKVQLHLGNLVEILEVSLGELLRANKTILPNFIQLNESLNCASLKYKIGIIDGFAFYMELKSIIPFDAMSPECQDFFKTVTCLCNNVLDNMTDFSKNLKDHINLYKAAFKCFKDMPLDYLNELGAINILIKALQNKTPELSSIAFKCLKTIKANRNIFRESECIDSFQDFAENCPIHSLSYLLLLLGEVSETSTVSMYTHVKERFILLLKESLDKLQKPEDFSQELKLRNEVKNAFYWLPETIEELEDEELVDIFLEKETSLGIKNLFLEFLTPLFHHYPLKTLNFFLYKDQTITEREERLYLTYCLEYLLVGKLGESLRNKFLEIPNFLCEKFSNEYPLLYWMLFGGNEVFRRITCEKYSEDVTENIFSSPNETTYSAIRIIHCLYQHNNGVLVDSLVEVLQLIWLNMDSHALFPSIAHAKEYKQLTYLLLESYKSKDLKSKDPELLFNLLRAPIDFFPEHFASFTDFLKTEVLEKSVEVKKKLFWHFLKFHLKGNSHSINLETKIMEFVIIPSFLSSMKKKEFEAIIVGSNLFIEMLLVCFNILKSRKSDLWKSMLRFSCIILECACHYNSEEFVKILKIFTESIIQVEDENFFDPITKSYWHLFCSYWFKITKVTLNKEIIPQILKNLLKSHDPDVREISRHGLDILIPVMKNEKNICTGLIKNILEEQNRSNSNLLVLEHILSVVVSHYKELEMSFNFVCLLVDSALNLLETSVFEYKKLSVDVIETILKWSNEFYGGVNESSGNELKENAQLVANFLFQLTCIVPLNRSDEELSKKCIDLLKNCLDLHNSFVHFEQWLDAETCPLNSESEMLGRQLCYDWDFIVNVIHSRIDMKTNEELLIDMRRTDKLSHQNIEAAKYLDTLEISLDLHSFVDLKVLCCAKIKDLNDLNICNGLEVLQHLLSKKRVDIFQLVVRNIRKIMRFFFKSSKEVVEACTDLFTKVLELSGNKSFNKSHCVKSSTRELHKFIDMFLENFVWKSEVSKTHSPSEAMLKSNDRSVLSPKEVDQIMDLVKGVSEALLKETGTFIDKCELQSKGWLVLKLVVTVYPVYINTYADILKKVLEDHLSPNMDQDGHDQMKATTGDSKLTIALDIIDIGSSEIIHDEDINDILSDLIERTNSRRIIISIISIIKKWLICTLYHETSVQKYLSVLRKISKIICVKFPNDVQVCLIYCEVIELLYSCTDNENHGYQLFCDLKKDLHSEVPEIQQKIFRMSHPKTPTDIFKQMKLLVSKEYWGSTAFSSVHCIEMIISCIKEVPMKNNKTSLQSSENVNKVVTGSRPKAELDNILNELLSFKSDLCKINTSSFFCAIKTLCELDYNLAQALWTELFSKLWKLMNGNNEMKQQLVTELQNFLKKQISVNKERKCVGNPVIFPKNLLNLSESPLPSHWFLEFIGNIPGLPEKVCQHLEDSILKSNFSRNLVCDSCLVLLSKTYSNIDGDILCGLLQLYGKSPETCTGFTFQQQGYAHKALKDYEGAMEELRKEAKKTKFQEMEMNFVETRGLECAKELGRWNDFGLGKEDGGLVNVYQDKIEMSLSSHNLQCLEEETLTGISYLIKDASSLCIEKWKILPLHILTPKHYTLLQARKKILEVEKVVFLREYLSDDLESCSIGLMNVTELCNLQTPSMDDNLSFWKEIYSFRKDLLKLGVKLIQQKKFLKGTDVQKLMNMVQLVHNDCQEHLIRACVQNFQSLHLKEFSLYESSKFDLLFAKLGREEYIQYLFKELSFHRGDNKKCKQLLNRGFSNPQFFQASTAKEEVPLMCVYHGLIASMQDDPEAEQEARKHFNKYIDNLDDWTKGWHECGNFFQKLFSSNPQRYDDYKSAMKCFIMACEYESERGSMELLAKIIWLLSFSYHDTSSDLQKLLNIEIKHIPTSYWLPWIPQLLTIFVKSTHNHLLPLLYAIGTKYPESLYFPMQSLLKKIHSSLEGTKHEKYKPCQEVMENLEKSHPVLSSTLHKIVDEFLVLSRNCGPDMLVVLKEIEVKICNLFFQLDSKLTYVDDIDCKIKEILVDSVCPANDLTFILDSIETRKFESLEDVMHEISKCRTFYEAEKKKIHRVFELRSQSKFFSLIHSFEEKIKLFNNSYEKQNSDVHIVRFLPQAEIVDRHGMCTCRVYIEGHNGKVYPYLIMSNETSDMTIKKEGRVFQFFSFLNAVLLDEKETRIRSLQYKVPAVISIHPCVKIIEDNVSSSSLLDIVNKHCIKVQQKRDIYSSCLSSSYKLYHNQKLHPNVRQLFMIEAFRVVLKYFVREAILKEFPNNYLQFRRNFCRNIALTVVSQYFFNLTEQVPEKTYIDASADIAVFGLTFNTESPKSGDPNSSFADNVPFNLQADILELMTSIEKSGYVKLAMLSVARCFKNHQEEVESLLKAILSEEMDDFQSLDHQKICDVVQTIAQKIEELAEFGGFGVQLDVFLNLRA